MKRYQMPELEFKKFREWAGDSWHDYISFTEARHGLRVRVSANLLGEFRITHGEDVLAVTEDWYAVSAVYDQLLEELG